MVKPNNRVVKTIKSGDQESLIRINELNKHELVKLHHQLQLAETTKAWKIMCALRRFNQQFLKGSNVERKKFVSWVKNKVLNKTINKESELAQFSPLNSGMVTIHDFEIQHDEQIIEHSPLLGNTQYIKYDLPSSYDVFRFPVIEWDFRWQRPQQIASQFADANHRVFYFSIDTNGIDNQSSKNDVTNRVQIRELRHNVWWIKLCSLKSLNAYRNVIDDENLKYLLQSIQFIKDKFNISHTISLVDLPFWTPLVTAVSNNKIIYDCMDDHSGFSTNSQDMLAIETKLFDSADLIVTTSQTLYDKVSKTYDDNTVLIRNAGEYSYFATEPKELAKEVTGRKGPVIGYYGAISEWFDIQLIEQLATRNKEWTFVLVGDTFGCDTTKATKLPNVIFTGERPYGELTSYLYGFNVCLIPFVKNELTLATNPVKVYEYLAAGKPVVSVELPELQVMSEVVSLATTVEQFEASIKENLIDTTEKQKLRKQFAEKNSWRSRYEALSSIIEERYYPKVSVIIVTYNNWSFTKQCLDSLFKNSEYPNLEVIIVDNASSDETRIELSRLIHPQIKIILSPINEGFAGGNNRGLKEATGKYLILLNNDTIVPKGWIQRLIKPLTEQSSLGMVGPMSNSVGNDQMLDFFIGDGFEGPNINWLNEFYEMYKGKIHSTSLLGFYCVAIKKEVYEIVGGLDRNYGIGMFEDDDYCEQVVKAGYELAIVEDAFVYHHGSVSFKKLEDEKYHSIFMTNKSYFENKWNKKWKFPNHPRSIFFNLVDASSISKKLSSIENLKVLFIGNYKWDIENKRHQKLAKELSNHNMLVLSHTHFYQNQELIGIRKLGPLMYLSNRLDLFENVHFDYIICSGSDEDFPSIKTIHKIVDAQSLNQYNGKHIDVHYIDENNIDNFIEKLKQLNSSNSMSR